MLRMLGMVLVIGACTALGLSARQKLVRRVNVITQMIQAFDFLIAEMQTNRTPLPSLISMLSQQDLPGASVFFDRLRARLERNDGLSFSYHWQRTAGEVSAEIGLEQAETDVLRQASSYLGRYQAEQQLAGLQHTKQDLAAIGRQAQQSLTTKGSIYRTCGIAVGVVVVLLML